MVIVYSLGIIFVTKLKPSLAPPIESFSWKEKFISLKGIWPVILLIVVVLGGIYSGYATVSESAAIGAFASILIAIVMRKLTLKGFIEAINKTLMSTTMILT